MVKLQLRCYDILGVLRSAPAAEVRSAYRKRALLLHPDKPGGSAEGFRQLVCAFETITSNEQRRWYNEALTRERSTDGLVLRCPPEAKDSAQEKSQASKPSSQASCSYERFTSKARREPKVKPQPTATQSSEPKAQSKLHSENNRQKEAPHVWHETRCAAPKASPKNEHANSAPTTEERASPQNQHHKSKPMSQAKSSSPMKDVATWGPCPVDASAIVPKVREHISADFDAPDCTQRLLDIDPKHWPQEFSRYQDFHLNALLAHVVLLVKRLGADGPSGKRQLHKLGDDIQSAARSLDVSARQTRHSCDSAADHDHGIKDLLMLCDASMSTSSDTDEELQEQDQEACVSACESDKGDQASTVSHLLECAGSGTSEVENEASDAECNVDEVVSLVELLHTDTKPNRDNPDELLAPVVHESTNHHGGSYSGNLSRPNMPNGGTDRKIRGVIKNPWGYFAEACVVNIKWRTRSFRNLDDAISSHIVIVSAKAQLPKDLAQRPDIELEGTLVKWFDDAKLEALQQGLDIRLSGCVNWWSRSRRRSIQSPVMQDVRALIRARRRLIDSDAVSIQALSSTTSELKAEAEERKRHRLAAFAEQRLAKRAACLAERAGKRRQKQEARRALAQSCRLQQLEQAAKRKKEKAALAEARRAKRLKKHQEKLTQAEARKTRRFHQIHRACEMHRQRLAAAEARKKRRLELCMEREKIRRRISRLRRLPRALKIELRSRRSARRAIAREALKRKKQESSEQHQAQKLRKEAQETERKQAQQRLREESRRLQEEAKQRQKEEMLKYKLLRKQGFSALPPGILFDAESRNFFAVAAISGLPTVEAPHRHSVSDAVADLQKLVSAAKVGGEARMQTVLVDMEIQAFSSECPLPWAT